MRASPVCSRMRCRGGTTLLVLLLGLMAGVVLALVAVPAWQAHRLRLHRVDARTELLSTAQRLADCYERLQAYDNPACTVSLPAVVADSTYQLQGTISAREFALRALPLGEQQADAECGEFQLDHRGQRRVTGKAASSQCW